MPEGWKKLAQAGLLLEPPTPPGLFLGCIHEPIEREINGKKARGFAYNAESYFLDSVKWYCTWVEEQIGKNVNLPRKEMIMTPFLPENRKDVPAGRPLCEGPTCLCLHRFTSLPFWNQGEEPPKGIGPADNGLSGGRTLASGSVIHPTRDAVPTFRSDDLKKRALDVDKWYDDVIVNGLPLNESAKSDDEAPDDSQVVFDGIGGEKKEQPRG